MTRGDARGFALILVLWIAALLAVIAASLVSSGRTETRLAHNLVENAKAEALADGAVQRAVLGLLDVDPAQAWRPGGGPYRLAYGEGQVRVTIADEDGKIDINAATPELLAGLLGQLGLDAERPTRWPTGSSSFAIRTTSRARRARRTGHSAPRASCSASPA